MKGYIWVISLTLFAAVFIALSMGRGSQNSWHDPSKWACEVVNLDDPKGLQVAVERKVCLPRPWLEDQLKAPSYPHAPPGRQ